VRSLNAVVPCALYNLHNPLLCHWFSRTVTSEWTRWVVSGVWKYHYYLLSPSPVPDNVQVICKYPNSVRMETQAALWLLSEVSRQRSYSRLNPTLIKLFLTFAEQTYCCHTCKHIFVTWTTVTVKAISQSKLKRFLNLNCFHCQHFCEKAYFIFCPLFWSG